MKEKIKCGASTSNVVYGLGFIGAAVYLFHMLLVFGWGYSDF